MNIPSRDALKTLVEQQQGPCISLFLPTHRSAMGTQQDLLRLKNQIREVENSLLLSKYHPAEKENLLKPLRALLEDEQFWLHPGDGLAIFRSPEVFHFHHLPVCLQEQVIVSDHFYLKPLLPFLTNDARFYILALSQKDVRLLECTRYSVREVNLPEAVPKSLAEALKYDDPDNQVRYHSSSSGALVGKGGRQAVIFHGQGVGIDDAKDNILRYFQQIDHGLHELLHNENAPLVLAGVEYLLSIYRKVNTYPHVLEQGVFGNPDKLKAEDMHRRAMTIEDPRLQKAWQDAAAYYRKYAGSERTSLSVKEVVPAAFYGRVELLFVAIDQEQWGVFDPTANSIHIHKEARFNDDDLLDIAATQTLLHGGMVYAVESGKVPDQAPLAAVFRY
ncbi:MAG TPA: hypothetical protein DHV65_14440 [Ktedonobacter sp.]|nr:hypothetical protein [Ktedonobacter sp.]